MLNTWILVVIWLLFLVFIYVKFDGEKTEETQETNKTKPMNLEKLPTNKEEELDTKPAEEEKILSFAEITLQFFDDERFNFLFKTENGSIQSFKSKLLFKAYFHNAIYWVERLTALIVVSKDRLIIMPGNSVYPLSRWQFIINDYSRVTVIDLKYFLEQPIHDRAELLLNAFEEKLNGKIGGVSREEAMKAAYEIARFLELMYSV